MNPIVVSGVSGHTGRVVAERLLAQKKSVRVLVRDERKGAEWKRKGAEVAIADLGDESALKKAFAGASAAYVLAPPKMDAADFLSDRKALLDVVARATKAAAVPHVVFLSSIGAHLAEGTGPILALRHGEQVLASAAPSVTFLRPPYFMENWAAVVPAVKGDAVLPTFLPASLAFPQIATKDIGIVAARELVTPGKGKKVLEISGPSASAQDVAAAFAQLLGKPVKTSAAPNAAVVPALTSMGLGRSVASLLAEMYRAMESGKLTFEKPASVERTPTLLAEGLRSLVG